MTRYRAAKLRVPHVRQSYIAVALSASLVCLLRNKHCGEGLIYSRIYGIEIEFRAVDCLLKPSSNVTQPN